MIVGLCRPRFISCIQLIAKALSYTCLHIEISNLQSRQQLDVYRTSLAVDECASICDHVKGKA